MGWVWTDKDTDNFNSSGDVTDYLNSPNLSSGRKACSTRKVIKSQCKTEEVETGKFIRKCEKTEEVLRECLGEPVEVLKSNKECIEDDVTDLMVGKGRSSRLSKFDESPFNFPGLRSDVEGIGRHFLGGINRFFEAGERMRNSLFDSLEELYRDSPSTSSPSMRHGIPIVEYPQKEAIPKPRKADDSGNLDLSGLARDV